MVTILNIKLPLENIEIEDGCLFRGDLKDKNYFQSLKELEKKLLEFGVLWAKVSQLGENSWRLYFSVIQSLPIKIDSSTEWLGII